MVSLIVQNLSKRYSKVVALDDLSFELRDSDILCILGPSGAGKSTLLHLLTGIVKADGGSAHLNGSDLLLKKPELRNIGYVPQDFDLFPHLSVFENVAFGLRVRNVPKRDVELEVQTLLNALEINDLGKRMTSQLSGGQRQRVAIGRAMATRPELVLLDEPFANLDRHLRGSLSRLIKKLQRDLGVPFVIVTHSLNDALSVSNKLMVLKHGARVEYGDTVEIYMRPASAFGADFLGVSNFLLVSILRNEDKAFDIIGMTADNYVSITPKSSNQKLMAVRAESVAILPENYVSGSLPIEGRVFSGVVSNSTRRSSHNEVLIEVTLNGRSGGGTVTAIAPLAKQMQIGQRVSIMFNDQDVFDLEN